MLHDTLVCNFDNVMFCGQEGEGGVRLRRNIVLCMIISYVLWVSVAALVSTIPLLGSLGVFIRYSMVFLVPVTGIQLAYGMAVTCFPLIPTCLVQDLVWVVQSTLPMHIMWPNAIQVHRERACPQQQVCSADSQADTA